MRKRKILLLTGLLISCLTYAQVQVGIGTENPQQLLHIKGASDASNPKATNDVVVTSDGNIGVGIVSPKAKLDINENLKGTSLLKIKDGMQGSNKILRSDASGNASWIDMPTTSGMNYQMTGTATYSNGTYALVKAIKVDESGFYQVLLRWWGDTSSVNAQGSTAAVFAFTTSTSDANSWSADQSKQKDTTEEYIFTAPKEHFCFMLPLSGQVNKGEYLKIYIKVSVGGPWLIGTVASGTSAVWMPSIVIYRI